MVATINLSKNSGLFYSFNTARVFFDPSTAGRDIFNALRAHLATRLFIGPVHVFRDTAGTYSFRAPLLAPVTQDPRGEVEGKLSLTSAAYLDRPIPRLAAARLFAALFQEA